MFTVAWGCLGLFRVASISLIGLCFVCCLEVSSQSAELWTFHSGLGIMGLGFFSFTAGVVYRDEMIN